MVINVIISQVEGGPLGELHIYFYTYILFIVHIKNVSKDTGFYC